jgi:hypothetical protein
MENLLAVYTFGQPRIGDKEFGEFMNMKLNKPVTRYLRVVYCNNLFPRMPYDGKLFMFKHFGVCLYYNSCYKEKVLIAYKLFGWFITYDLVFLLSLSAT